MSAQETIGKEISAKRETQSEAARMQYLAQLPEDKRSLHQLLKVLEVASLVIVVVAFTTAMYVSINYRDVAPMTIATAWFAFPISLTPLMILLGAHAIALRAYLPVAVPGMRRDLVTGSSAVRSGAGQVLTGLGTAIFWGVFVWALRSGDVRLIGIYGRVLGTLMAVTITVSIVVSIIAKLVRH